MEVPFRIVSQSQKRKNPNNDDKEMQIVGPISISISSTSSFELPDGWVVERRPRKASDRQDKYYYEPGSGQQFRSLLSVQKYLSGEIDFAPKRLKPGNENSMQIVPHIFKSSSTFNLPEGWVVEEKPRSNINYAGVVDRYYIEPETQKRFRSLISVERYLTEGNECTSSKSSKSGALLYLTDGKECSTTSKHAKDSNFNTRPIACNEDELSNLNLSSPPLKLKWVLNPGTDTWNALMDGVLISNSIKHKWCQSFVRMLDES